MLKKLAVLNLIVLFALPLFVFAQDAQELKAERETSKKLKGEHPLVGLMKTKPSALKPELNAVHPRVFLTQSAIERLKEKTVSQKELWQTALSRVRALTA